MKTRIFHNPRCRKSRAGLEYLRGKTDNVEVIDYIRDGLRREDVELIIRLLGIKPAELVRTQEEYYKKELKGKSISDQEWPVIISGNPKLLRRPVVIKGDKAVIGDPAENIDKLF